MITRVRKFLSPPIFEGDEDRTLTANLLNTVFNALSVALLFLIIGGLLGAGSIAIHVVILLDIVIVQALRWLMWRGRMQLAGVLLVLVFSGSITTTLYLLGTVRAPAALFYMLVIVEAGLLAGNQAMLAIVVVNSVSVLGLIVAERSGWLPAPDLTVGITQWVTFTVIFSLTAVLLNLTQRAITAALARARRELAERRRAETALRESEARWRSLVENAPDFIATFDLEGRFTFVNRTVAGITAEQIIGQPAYGFAPPEFHADLRQAFDRVTRTGETESVETVGLGPHGASVWYSIRLGPILREGVVDSLIMISTDVTQRKRAEEELRLSEARYRAVVENQTEFIVRWKPDGTRTFVNEAYRRFFGLTSEQAIAASFMPLIVEEDRGAVEEKISRLLSGVVTSETDNHRVIKPDGSIAWQEWVDQAIHDDSGQIVGFQSVGRDITERKRAEEELHHYAERLRILHEIDVAILAARSPEAIAQAALHRIYQLVPWQRADVALFDWTANEAVVLAVSAGDETALPSGARVSLAPYQEQIQAGKQNQAVVIRDAALVPQALYMQGLRCGLLAPLLWRDELIGSLNLWAGSAAAFPPAALDIAREVADQLAIAIQQARLLAETTESLAREQRLNVMAHIISSTLDLVTLLEKVMRLAVELVGADAGILGLVSSDGERIDAPYAFNLPPALQQRSLPKGQGIAWQIVATGKSVLLSDYGSHPKALPEWVSAGVRGFIGVPVVSGETILGAAVLIDLAVHDRFTERDLALVEAIGRQAGVAIENARLFEAERAARERADALVESTRALSSTLSLPAVLQRILAECQRVASCVSGAVIGLEAGTPKMMAFTGYEYDEMVQRRIFERDLLDSSILTRLIQDSRPLIIDNVDEDPNWKKVSEHGHIRSWLGVPLIVRDRLIGILSLDGDRPRAFTPAHVESVQAISAQAAIAIENARLFEAERAARERADVLRAASFDLTQTLNLDTILASLLDHVRQLVPYDSANIMLLETDNRLAVRMTSGYENWTDDPETVLRTSFDIQATPNLSTVVTTQKSFLIADTAQYAGWLRIPAREYIRSWLGVPLVVGSRVIGLYSLDKAEPNFFTEGHVRLAEALAAQATIAIQNARLFEQVSAGREQLHALSQRLVQVQEEERRHLARELHDEIGQTLTGLKLVLELIPRLGAKTVRARVDEALALLNNLMDRVHGLSLDLRPAMLDDLGLPSALLWLFERYTQQTGVRVNSEFAKLDERLPPEVETTTYRIAQEALTNVARHARVKEVRVRLLAEPSVLRIQIQDEGVGFGVEAALASGARAGLAGMRERVLLLGGWLKIDSAPGAGTQVAAVLPLKDRREWSNHDRLNSTG